MRFEVQEIEDDGEALHWAMGCVLAGYREGAMIALQAKPARWLFAIVMLGLAWREFFAPLLTLAYKLGDAPLARLLGRLTPGDDYRRFIPLMDATPLWIQAMWVMSAVLLIAAAVALLWKKRAAFGLFASAMLLEIAGTLISRQIPAYHAAFAFTSFHWMRDVAIPAAQIVSPVLMAVALWAMTERTPRSSS
ncbi:MAG: hypothetical protein KGJ78_07505 [Alphaproteobacteria bacterium]|nr:hypothetical protein [Alphaproteobacteria bacterium]